MINKNQKANIRNLKIKYTNIIPMGKAKYIAIPFIPEFFNEYRLSKNRRKSNKTLPPFSPAYSEILFE